MKSRKISVRLDAREQEMLSNLGTAWAKLGIAMTPSDVLRRCLLLAENHRRRSSRKEELRPLPGDTNGEARRGRPRKATPQTPTESSCLCS